MSARKGGPKFSKPASMSPELEKLLEAYDAKLTCAPEEKAERLATFERLLADALIRFPGASRNALPPRA